MFHLLFLHKPVCLYMYVPCLTNHTAACNFLIRCAHNTLDRCQPCYQILRDYWIKQPSTLLPWDNHEAMKLKLYWDKPCMHRQVI